MTRLIRGEPIELAFGVFERSKRWRFFLRVVPLLTFRSWGLAVVYRKPRHPDEPGGNDAA